MVNSNKSRPWKTPFISKSRLPVKKPKPNGSSLWPTVFSVQCSSNNSIKRRVYFFRLFWLAFWTYFAGLLACWLAGRSPDLFTYWSPIQLFASSFSHGPARLMVRRMRYGMRGRGMALLLTKMPDKGANPGPRQTIRIMQLGISMDASTSLPWHCLALYQTHITPTVLTLTPYFPQHPLDPPQQRCAFRLFQFSVLLAFIGRRGLGVVGLAIWPRAEKLP